MYTRWEDADPATETFFKGNTPGPTEPGTIKVQSPVRIHQPSLVACWVAGKSSLHPIASPKGLVIQF